MRIVIKVGTSTLTHASGRLNIRRVEQLCKVISDLKNAGHEIVLVSSGAIAMGVGKLGLLKRPQDMPTKQAAAAVGQCELMDTYDRLFSDYHHTVAQILLTGSDIDTLGAVVAVNAEADLLILLSDIDGLYTGDPHTDPEAKLIDFVPELTPEILALGGGSVSGLGTGGMATKLHAAQLVTQAGCNMVIANGERPELLYEIIEGRRVGTRFAGRSSK